MIVVWLFLTMPWVCLQFVIVVFTDHTHLLFLQALNQLFIQKETTGLRVEYDKQYMSILCSIDNLIQSKHVDKAVPFYDQWKRLKLKTLASDGVIKKDNFKTITLLIYCVKLQPLISDLVLETLLIIEVKGSIL